MALWINEVESWFGIMTQKAIRGGSFPKVGELTRKVNAFVEHDNGQASPCMYVARVIWVARSESMLWRRSNAFINIFLGRYTSQCARPELESRFHHRRKAPSCLLYRCLVLLAG